MRRLFNTNINHEGIHFLLLVTRLAIAGFMLAHGLPKLSGLIGPGPIQFGDPIGIGTTASLVLTVFAEVICSVLLILGLATRLATIPLIVTMLVAILVVHAADAFSVKELAFHYLLVYVFLLIAGSGKYSIDHLIGGKQGRRRR